MGSPEIFVIESIEQEEKIHQQRIFDYFLESQKLTQKKNDLYAEQINLENELDKSQRTYGIFQTASKISSYIGNSFSCGLGIFMLTNPGTAIPGVILVGSSSFSITTEFLSDSGLLEQGFGYLIENEQTKKTVLTIIQTGNSVLSSVIAAGSFFLDPFKSSFTALKNSTKAGELFARMFSAGMSTINAATFGGQYFTGSQVKTTEGKISLLKGRVEILDYFQKKEADYLQKNLDNTNHITEVAVHIIQLSTKKMR